MNNNIFKTLKMKIKEGEDYNSSSCDLDNMSLSKRRASVCRLGGDEPYHEREKRGRSVPIIRKTPIILRLRNNNPALSASPVPEQSSDRALCVQGLKICTKLPTVRIPKLKLKPGVINQLRTGARKVPPPQKRKIKFALYAVPLQIIMRV